MNFLISSILFFIISIRAQIPKSPFGDPTKICVNTDGTSVRVDGFRSTPFKIEPFVDTFVNPPILPSKFKTCRDDNHCIYSYELDILDIQLRPFDKAIPRCKALSGTWMIGYNGMVPGPTIINPSGHESLVRFNNKVGKFFKDQFHPCLPNNKRSGRPFSVHLHGSASLAPFDGWAEDEICSNETKDYVYPNNRPTTGWYHDHALRLTADNAYLGAAGMYIISSGCGAPWNLDNVEERHMILSDKVLDKKCQLFIDHFQTHKDDLYGDINLVSGIPFPLMPLEAITYRFRIVNAAISRPYLIKIKNEKLVDVAPAICKIILTDGGYRLTPADFPSKGLLVGVAERFDIVCDFTTLKNQTLFFWNDYDKKDMKAVPYFCYSHLIAKIVVSNSGSGPAFDPKKSPPHSVTVLDKVLSAEDLKIANLMASRGIAHREFVFGRSNGHWVINGEGWASFKLAATDIGQNTWEVWRFKTGGGWFHPVHIHLIDFFMLRREGSRGLENYETMSSKDVLYLGPSNTIYVIARFGPHKGDYMFHCHNLIHEDNDMMRAMRIMGESGNKNAISASMYIRNPLYNIIYNNWQYTDPMLGETAAKRSSLVEAHDLNLVNRTLYKNLHRIFYPTLSDIAQYKNSSNPWQVKWC